MNVCALQFPEGGPRQRVDLPPPMEYSWSALISSERSALTQKPWSVCGVPYLLSVQEVWRRKKN